MRCIKDKLNKVDLLINNYEYKLVFNLLTEIISESPLTEDEYKLAFNLLNKIISDSRSTDDDLADALLLKGAIVGACAPYLTEFPQQDETGLIYFLKAFEYNPYELSILFNILNSFSQHDMTQEYTREHKYMFVKAYDVLRDKLFDTLDEDSKEDLLKFSNQYINFTKEISNTKK